MAKHNNIKPRLVTYTNGETRWQVRYQVKRADGTTERKSQVFETKAKAETHAAQVRTKIANEGKAAFSLPEPVRVAASEAITKLEPYGVTIADAVNYYVDHVLKYRNAPCVSDIVKRLVAEAESNKRRAQTVKDLRSRVEPFSKTFGERQLSSITREELANWLNNPKLSARSRINYATKISQLYNFAIRNEWAENNVAASIPRPTAEDSEPAIFTVPQAAKLLEFAEEFDLLAYIAIGLFAGLRSAEIARLDWKDVKLAERSIIIGSHVAKKRSRRVVDINDTLAAWLPSCAKLSGLIIPFEGNRTLYTRLAALAKKAGLEAWPDNGLRHSCASYSLAATGDAVRVAYQLGNSADMIHRHYKALVTKADAERFFALRPGEAESDKVVPMPKAVNQ